MCECKNPKTQRVGLGWTPVLFENSEPSRHELDISNDLGS